MIPADRRFLQTSCAALGALAGLLVAQGSAHATQYASPEARTLAISRNLHPIADEEWQNIAGERASEAYSIIKGDTLYDISQRLFGDPKYWPKIWAINNRTIVNPHLIYPGNSVSFMPGSGSSLPAVAVTAQNDSGAEAANPAEGGGETQSDYHPTTIGRSQDWRHLPLQHWESATSVIPRGVDRLGFDNRSKIRFRTAGFTDMPSIASTDRIDFKGRLFASEADREYLFVGDTVFLQGDQQLAVGQTYALTKDPATLNAPHSDRSAYSYRILGRIKVTSVHDNLYVGTVLALSDVVGRGVNLIPMPERIPEPGLIPADKEMEGTMTYDEEVVGSPNASQHRWVYVDRGTEDGVKPGMVFRNYLHNDPNTHGKITDSDLLPSADFVIVFCTPHYSTARVLRGYVQMPNGLPVSVLTSLDELKHFDTPSPKAGSDGSKTEAPPGAEPAIDSANPPEPENPDKANSSPEPGGPEAAPPAPDAGPPEQPPAAGGAPPPPEAAPPPELVPAPTTSEPAHAGTGNGSESELPPPPPEVAPMPDIPASPSGGGAPVPELSP